MKKHIVCLLLYVLGESVFPMALVYLLLQVGGLIGFSFFVTASYNYSTVTQQHIAYEKHTHSPQAKLHLPPTKKYLRSLPPEFQKLRFPD